MIKVSFYQPSEIDDSLLKFAVIASRYQDKWIFCRHKERDTWEIPGGHREPGEAIEETARRELSEETGACRARLRPVAVYGVERGEMISYGMLFWAKVEELGELPPEMEMQELLFSDVLPSKLTYPDIQPHLHEKVQKWLNLQSNADELWDVYDENRNLTGRLHRRGEPMKPGEYHLAVHIWIKNSRGEYLLTRRSPSKGFPNMWETTGGSALAGDDSLTAALREVREETGLALSPEKGSCVKSYRKEEYFCDVWLFHQDFDLKDVVLLEGETSGVMYASREKILEMRAEGIFVPYFYLTDVLAL